MTDNLYIHRRIRIYKDSVIRIKRQLPSAKGNLRVALGQEVAPPDILGEGSHLSGFRTIQLARELGVGPKSAARHLKRALGKTIYQGELLAFREGFLGLKKRMLTSPVDGVLDYYDEKSGCLKIKLLPRSTKLISGAYGLVEDVDNLSGTVVIKIQANIIHTVLGTGKERVGLLKVLGSSSDLISAKQISDNVGGNILVGGGLVSLDALGKAMSLGASGFITGGINFGDYKTMGGSGMVGVDKNWRDSKKRWSDVGLTLLVTEGFGLIPMGEDIFGMLKNYEGKFALLDGNNNKLILPSQEQNSMMYIRKVALPKVPDVKVRMVENLVEAEVGMKARIISAPFLGCQGTIEAIDGSPTKLPSGVVTTLVTIVTKAKKVKMPYQNLEIIG